MFSTNAPPRKSEGVDSVEIAKAKYWRAYFSELHKIYSAKAVEADAAIKAQIESGIEQCRDEIRRHNVVIAQHHAAIALRRKIAARRVAAAKRAFAPRHLARARRPVRRPARRPAKAALASTSSSDGPAAPRVIASPEGGAL
ncbi:MAG: hypothetical protein ACR652_01260 [Methylocystis sp.]|uniref:hypothetical protein n=1 Tax=Methylocystis sp. TaxID=1911079 RepID=UPI003DA3D45B